MPAFKYKHNNETITANLQDISQLIFEDTITEETLV